MAEDIKKVVKVEVGDSQVTIKSLRQEMSELRDTILNTKEGTKQYEDAVSKLQANQQRLNDVMKLTKGAAKDGADATKQLRDQIKQYRNEVLEAEEGTEEWTRAMENLANAQFELRDINEQARYSATDFGEQLGNVTRITQGVAAGFSAANAAVALFGGESEDLQKVMVKLQAGIAIVQGLQGLEGMNKSVTGLSNAIKSKLIPSIKNAATAMGTAGWVSVILIAVTAITALVMQLIKMNKEVDIAEQAYNRLNNKLTSTSKSIQQLQREHKRELDLMKAEGATEEQLINQRIKNTEKYRDLVWQNVKDLRRQIEVEQDETRKDDLTKSLEKAELEYYNYVQDIADLQNNLKVLEIQANKTAAATAEILANAPESTLTGDEVTFDETPKVTDNTQIKTKSNGAADKYGYAIAAKELTLRKQLSQALLLDDEERYKKEIELTNAFNEEKMRLLNEAILKENDLTKAASLMIEKANLEVEIEENKNAQLAELRRKEKEQQELDLQNRVNAVSSAVQTTSSLFGSIADIYESGDKENEKNAKKAKQMKIAQATIDTLWGSVTAYMTTLKGFPAPINMVLAPLNAAATLAAGMATIAKIKNSDPINGSGVGASVSPTQTYSTAMPMTADNQATNLNNIDYINADSRVYILESDIANSNKRVQVRESETTF